MATPVSERVQEQLDQLRNRDWNRYVATEDEGESSLSFFTGLILGLLVGVIVALFLAPQPGSNTREQVKQTGIELLPTGNNSGEDEEDI